MKLKLFLQDTMSLGKGAMKLPIEGTIQKYRNSYKEIIEKQHKKFIVDSYKTPSGRVIVHVKVPSESLPKFYYDVLIELISSPNVHTFEECDIRIFSNSPSFVYYYAYVFYHLSSDENKKDDTGMMIDIFKNKIPRDRLLLPGAEKKLGEEPLTMEPVIKNPYGVPLFDKSIYLAIFYLIDKMDFNRIIHTTLHYSLNQIVNNVESFDKLMLLRQQVERRYKEKQRNIDLQNNEKLKTVKKEMTRVNHSTGIKSMMSPKSSISSSNNMKSASTNNAVKHIGRKEK